MVPIDWERISNSIKHDATIRYSYTIGDDHCVLGGLAVDYGVALPEPSANNGSIGSLRRFPIALSLATGLDDFQLARMQYLNDDHDTVEGRRAALLAWVDDEKAKVVIDDDGGEIQK